MKLFRAHTNLNKATCLAVAGALALPVLLTIPQAAQATPPRHAPAWGWRAKHRRVYRYYYRARPGYRGIVTRVRSRRQFDVSIGGRIFNVYTTSVVPRRLDRGDSVRVYGYRVGSNDIRNAGVTITRNR